MAYAIQITEDADRQLRSLTVRDQRIVETGIGARLSFQPTFLSRSVKRLRPNPFAEYELRLGDLRVLYNVVEATVTVVVVLVGKKSGNTLLIEGVPFDGHQDRPAG